eukprot:Em0007g26a
MFLDVLGRFVEEHKEYLDDFLFLMLLRLLHRQGTDMLSSVHYKLMAVLELIRKNFEPEQQFMTLCRILTDPQQPMNTKVKQAWLEYFLELIGQVESSDFKDDPETQQMVARLLDMTSDPGSMELKRSAPACSGMSPRNNKMTPTRLSKHICRKCRVRMGRREEMRSQQQAIRFPHHLRFSEVSKSPSHSKLLGTRPPLGAAPGPVPRPSSRNAELSAPSLLVASRAMCSSSPDLSAIGPAPSTRSHIPTPSAAPVSSPNTSRIPMLRRPNSTTPGKSSTPQALRKGTSPQGGGVRSASVDPERMSERAQAMPRPSSVRSHSSLRILRTGSSDMEDIKEGSSPSNSAASSQFSFSDLTKLDFGSPEHGGLPPSSTAPPTSGDRDEVDLIVMELATASSSKLRGLALQSLLTFSREYPNKCNWEKNMAATMRALLGLLDDEEPPTRTMALRVVREILKTSNKMTGEFSEPLTLKVVKSFADNDTSVSQAAEDIFSLLAPALPNESTLLLLIPMAAKEKYPMLLGVIKFLTKVVALSKDEFLSQHLSALVPSVVRGYCHTESSVRKTSVFCLVAIHAVVGEKIREYLSKLTSSQVTHEAAQAGSRSNGTLQSEGHEHVGVEGADPLLSSQVHVHVEHKVQEGQYARGTAPGSGVRISEGLVQEGNAHDDANHHTHRGLQLMSSLAKKRQRSQSAGFPRTRRFSYESPDKLKERELGFVLDGVVLSRLANEDTKRSNPSLNIGIPQYNALRDPANQSYLRRRGLPKTVKEIAEDPQKAAESDSMMGKVFDHFVRSSEAITYLKDVSKKGAGYSRKLYGGHLTVPTLPAIDGYNGPDGYRKNTPELREKSSVFDYTDPFDVPKPINRRLRTQSAPATIQLMRQKSASVYRSYPVQGRRIMSAACPDRQASSAMGPRPLATGPIT